MFPKMHVWVLLMLQQSLNHFKFNQPDITFAPYKSSQAYDEWFCAQTVYILNVHAPAWQTSIRGSISFDFFPTILYNKWTN